MPEPTPKRCFVISPIGQPGSDVRDHADDVFDYIIKPAMDEVGMTVYRADHDQKIGKITDQMFDSILSDDLCIAVLSFQNPNVYYELAVAQCAARPVIILNEKGHPLPFDIKDLRVIEYTLRPKMIFEKVYVKQIVEMVGNLEALNWTVPVPFGHHLSPLGRSPSDFVYRGQLETFVTTDRWLAMLGAAERAIDVNGINLKYWIKMPAFRTLVERKAAAGCRFRFMLMHPENVALPQYANPSISGGSNAMALDMVPAANYFRGLSATCSNVGVRQLRVGCHHQQMVRIDDTMYISLVVFSETTRRMPTIECTARSSLYAIMRTEFDALWDANPDPPAIENPQ